MGRYEEARLEDYNYHMDHRTRAAYGDKPWSRYDAQRFVLSFSMSNEDGDEEEVELPAKFEVCSTCRGRGRYVSPGVDAGGITPADFSDDPDFRSDYASGVYDVPCAHCDGKRVVPVVDEGSLTAEQKKVHERVERNAQEDAEFERMCAQERAMGA